MCGYFLPTREIKDISLNPTQNHDFGQPFHFRPNCSDFNLHLRHNFLAHLQYYILIAHEALWHARRYLLPRLPILVAIC